MQAHLITFTMAEEAATSTLVFEHLYRCIFHFEAEIHLET